MIENIEQSSVDYQRKDNVVFFLMLLLFPYIQLRTYGDFPRETARMYVYFYRITTAASATIVYLLYLKNKSDLENIKFLRYFVIYWLVYLTSTFLNYPVKLFYVATVAYSWFGLALLVAICCKKWLGEFLQAITNLFCIWIYLNFILDILYPDGVYRTVNYHTAHLLGDDNAMVFVMLPGVLLSICNSLYKYGSLNFNSILLILVCSYSLLSVWAVSAFLSMFLFVCLLIFILRWKYIDPRLMLLGLVATMIFCIFGLSTPLISSFVENTLEKDMTLTGRTFLWAQAIFEIIQHPILGYGGYFQYGSWTIQIGDIVEYPCHTPYLQLLLDGGVILFSVTIFMIVMASEVVRKNKSNIIGIILMAGLVSMLFNYITEYSQLYYVYIILILMYNIRSLVVPSEVTEQYEENC